jgi:hypothetical protein
MYIFSLSYTFQGFKVRDATKTANVQPSNTMTVITGLTASINYAFVVSYDSNTIAINN